MSQESRDFYTHLPALNAPLEDVLLHPEYFQAVPNDWAVVVTDVKNSTQAVEQGKYQDVNLLAASSIIACLNLAEAQGIQIPFVFGGDGAVCLVPENMVTDVLKALTALQLRGERLFQLYLRVGSVAVKDLIAGHHPIGVAKLQMADGYRQAMCLGEGLAVAERLVKAQTINSTQADESLLNLEGLECRWNTVQPPSKQHKVLCVVAQAATIEAQPQVYRELLADIHTIFGSYTERHPVRTLHLRLSSKVDKIRREVMIKFGDWYGFHLIPTWVMIQLARVYFKYNLRLAKLRGKEYLTQLVAATDTLKIDSTLKTIVTGTDQQISEFLRLLNRREQQGELKFGQSVVPASLLTCYVRERNAGHIHFLDGVNGGYTVAGKVLKKKM